MTPCSAKTFRRENKSKSDIAITPPSQALVLKPKTDSEHIVSLRMLAAVLVEYAFPIGTLGTESSVSAGYQEMFQTLRTVGPALAPAGLVDKTIRTEKKSPPLCRKSVVNEIT
jgi:hypothetical protein